LRRPRGDVLLFQQLLLLLGLQPQRPRDEEREGARILDVGHRDLQLLGQVGHLLDDLGERAQDVALQGDELRGLLHDVGQLGDVRDEIGVLLIPGVELHALGALDEDPQRAVGDLEHARDGADDAHVVELVRTRYLVLGLPRSDHDEHPVARQHVVDEPDGALLADGQRHERVGQGHGLAQREHGQAGRKARAAPDLHVLGSAGSFVGRDLDHGVASTSIGTWRERRSGCASGSSTRRIPSR
jgi:hypothetical protein